MKRTFFKPIYLLFLSFAFIFLNNTTATGKNTDKIKVAVFDGHGGAQTCIWEAVAAVKLDSGMTVRTINSADIANNVLDSLDAIIIPGGGGSRQFLNLGAENQNRIKKFVKNGKGIVGICAGAYLLSNTPEYSCMAMNGAQATDIEHDNRGHGIAKFTLSAEGKQLFPELKGKDTCFVMYYEGPVFISNDKDSIIYKTFAIMQSDVHEEGNAPENMTNNKPFFIANNYGKGKVFCSIAHPEGTPGMMWMIPRMVRWTLNLPITEYKSEAVNPDLFNKEILMTIDDLKKEASMFKVFLYGTPQEKTDALDWLQKHQSWDAKRWVQGLLYDASPEVRIGAAKYIGQIQYLQYLPDLCAAYKSEKNNDVKNSLKIEIDKLKAIEP